MLEGRVKERPQPLRSHQPRSDDHFPPRKLSPPSCHVLHVLPGGGVVCTGTRSPSPPTPGSRRVRMVKVSGARRSGEAGVYKDGVELSPDRFCMSCPRHRLGRQSVGRAAVASCHPRDQPVRPRQFAGRWGTSSVFSQQTISKVPPGSAHFGIGS